MLYPIVEVKAFNNRMQSSIIKYLQIQLLRLHLNFIKNADRINFCNLVSFFERKGIALLSTLPLLTKFYFNGHFI